MCLIQYYDRYDFDRGCGVTNIVIPGNNNIVIENMYKIVLFGKIPMNMTLF